MLMLWLDDRVWEHDNKKLQKDWPLQKRRSDGLFFCAAIFMYPCIFQIVYKMKTQTKNLG